MDDRQLFLGNLCTVTVEELRAYCEPYGALGDFTINRDKDQNIYHCFAFITFKSSRSVPQFMSKRPHCINGEVIFVKRALSRLTASIPERLVVTNRLVVQNSSRYSKTSLLEYFEQFGHIRQFDYERGFIDYDDYDHVDRALIARPHFIRDKEISVTKATPTEQPSPSMDDGLSSNLSRIMSIHDDENFRLKYESLQKHFEEYKSGKERELTALRTELERTKEDLADITQIKLDKLLKNQQRYHSELLLYLLPTLDSPHAQMSDTFLQSASTKKRKATT